MSIENIEETVVEIVNTYLGHRDIKLATLLKQDLGADELDIAAVSMAIEDAFNIQITDIESEAWKTVKDIIDLVAKKK